jgi:cell fate regulator YaaT (PSP1 superfamily)
MSAEEDLVLPLKMVVRMAAEGDYQKVLENRRKEEEAFRICQEKIGKHNLDMKLVDVEYTFDRSKIIFTLPPTAGWIFATWLRTWPRFSHPD